jgi:putative endonuclease
MYFVYILLCEDDSLYTGIATDVSRRLAEHRNGKGAKYTRSHKPVRIVYREKFRTRSTAQKREAEIKGWSRTRKVTLIETMGG